MIMGAVLGASIKEVEVLKSAAAGAAMAACFAAAAVFCVVRNNRLAEPGLAELRFEEEPSDRLLSLDLS